MKLRYAVLGLGMLVVGAVWALFDERSFNSFWWIAAIGGTILSAAWFMVDGKHPE